MKFKNLINLLRHENQEEKLYKYDGDVTQKYCKKKNILFVTEMRKE